MVDGAVTVGEGEMNIWRMNEEMLMVTREISLAICMGVEFSIETAVYAFVVTYASFRCRFGHYC